MFGHIDFHKRLDTKEMIPSQEPCFTNQYCQIYSSSRPFEINGIIIILEGHILRTLDGMSIQREAQEKVVFESYQKYGEKFLSNLDGLFRLVLIDTQKIKVIIGNNRYQTTNFYYAIENDVIIFSKSLKKLLEYRNKSPQAHLGAIKSFLSTGFTIPDQTQIKGVKKLLPSFWISVTPQDIKVDHHWNQEFSFERRKKINLDEELQRYESIYQEGLRNYFEAYGTESLGCLMSGGHDTSFALIQASKVFPKKIHTFTTTFPGWVWNEESYAKNIASKFGAESHFVPFLPEDMDLVADVVSATEEPVVSVSIPMFKLAKEASGYVDTMIGGDGGDTLWGEYYPVAEYHRWVKNFPLFLRKMIFEMSRLLRKATDWERFWELEHVSSLFLEKNYYDDFLRKLCTYRHFNNDQLSKILTPEFMNEDLPRSLLEIPFNKNNFRDALIEGKLFNGFYTYMSFFTYKEMESFDLNLYFPTINKRLMDFITTLPYEWVNGGTFFHRLTNDKSINRKLHKMALSKYLRSEEIYNRSFDIPWYNILRPRKKVLSLLLKRLKSRGWYQEQNLDLLFQEFEHQKVKEHELLELKHHGYRIYTLLSLEIWAMIFLDGHQLKNISLEDILSS